MRRILQASAIMGLSSVVTVGLSALRYKLLALQLGPEGIGTLGLFATTLALGVTLFGVGIGSSGIRQVAASRADEDGFGAATRAALFRGSWLLGFLAALIGLILFPFLRAALFAGVPVLLVVWLIVAVAASVVSSGQVALLNGMGRLSEIARANSFGAILGTGLTVLLLVVAPQWALAMAFAGTPLAVLVFTTWYARNLHGERTFSRTELWNAFKPMLLFGLAFSGSLLLSSLVQVVVRVLISKELGLKNVGYFQAAWTIANVYLGFVINAMATEYYPRISAIAHDVAELNRQVNTQIRIILLLATPLILLMVMLAPTIMAIMYAPEFAQATALLRWQLLGDIIKMASWPIGFLLLAREAKRSFFFTELIWNVSFLGLTVLLIGPLGLKGLGLAYGCSYMLYFAMILWVGRRLTGYVVEKCILWFVLLSLSLGIIAEMQSGSSTVWTLCWRIAIILLIIAMGIFTMGFRENLSFSLKYFKLRLK